MKGLLRRASTAVIFVVVMLGGLYAGRYSFIALFALIAALCLWEFFNMVLVKFKRRDKIRMFLGIAFGLTPILLATLLQMNLVKNQEQFIIATSLLFFPFIFLAFIYELYTASSSPFLNIAFLVLGMVYIGAPFALLDFVAFEGEKFSGCCCSPGRTTLSLTSSVRKSAKTNYSPAYRPEKPGKGPSGAA